MWKSALILCMVVAVTFALHHHHHHHGKGKGGGFMKRMTRNITECQDFLATEEDGYSMPNCGKETVECFRGVHKMAKGCVGKEMKKWRDAGEAPKQCYKENMQGHMEWFRLSCLWHSGVQKCMNNEAVDGVFKHDTTTDDHSEADGHPHHHVKDLKAKTCWTKVHEETDACVAKSKEEGSNCANYQYCAGKEMPAGTLEDAERLKQWYTAANHLKLMKHKQTVDNHKKIQDCISQKNEEV